MHLEQQHQEGEQMCHVADPSAGQEGPAVLVMREERADGVVVQSAHLKTFIARQRAGADHDSKTKKQ